MEKSIVFFDTEVNCYNNKIFDIGAVSSSKGILRTPSMSDFCTFIEGTEYICGHNIFRHDLETINEKLVCELPNKKIDTLFISPLMFPTHPYHKLLKDDKLQVEELNNPVNDSKKASLLFYDEVNQFYKLSEKRKRIYCNLLYSHKEFNGFFDYLDMQPTNCNLTQLILEEFEGKICENTNLENFIEKFSVELAYALALIGSESKVSITPPWLLYNYPEIEYVIKKLCNTPCKEGCNYCKNVLDIHRWLKETFGYDEFRKFENEEESLQEKAVQAAVDGKSLLAIFPTGGGKSITFQLPALMAGKLTHGLTVVISPLLSLMKDQVDNLVEKGIENVVTINGMMNPIERSDAILRVKNGKANLLYISPEQLRSGTIENILKMRNVVRFVIDEAHCFSSWGQDFRVDYLYIADFIKKLQEDKGKQDDPIQVSCFTATAKKKVVTDICEYFKEKLDLNLEVFVSKAPRKNLHYKVIHKEIEEEKYKTLRMLIEEKKCPTIVYVSRVKKSIDLAERLTIDGYSALAYNGKMDTIDKVTNQETFMNNEVPIIVATSAFGMGVDKSDVRLVVHYDISDSLENYIQEAGRAGRDQKLEADCYILFNESDIDKHFILLNQTKVNFIDVKRVWSALKGLMKGRSTGCFSALEIARHAGWDETDKSNLETRVRTALTTLENGNYIKRDVNIPRIYATSIQVKNVSEAANQIRKSDLFSEDDKLAAIRIITSLVSKQSIAKAGKNEAESRVDYIADNLGLELKQVIREINLMRQSGILADWNDVKAHINPNEDKKSFRTYEEFVKLERFILSKLETGYLNSEGSVTIEYKKLNEEAQESGIKTCNIRKIKRILYFLSIKNYIQKESKDIRSYVDVIPQLDIKKIMEKFELRIDLCRFILDELYEKLEKQENVTNEGELKQIDFSVIGLYRDYQDAPKLTLSNLPITISDIEDALLYLSKIEAIKLDGGFLVLYNGMKIKRLIKGNRVQFKIEDYKLLKEFYQQKIYQIHIVSEYAKLMIEAPNKAMKFVEDYFYMDFDKFLKKYFEDDRIMALKLNITEKRYNELFGELSKIQKEIINDKSKNIVVAAGPGSGKTRVLVHKLASLCQLEDVKHEQLLMLTFSRVAATEFKKRLYKLIGSSANYIEIKTFHSYCFDLLGKIGTLESSENVIEQAIEMIRNGEVEIGKITKTVLVIDEAQDMSEIEFSLICTLMEVNEDMRIIAVGDDDQNIYEFRGSNSKYFKKLIDEYGAVKYEMVENYRSKANIVALANKLSKTISNRIKKEEIIPVNKADGNVQIIHHDSENMEQAVVNNIIDTYKGGDVCVLTETNDEAFKIMGLLLKNGKRARLIHSLDGFRLINLIEVKYLLDIIKKDLQTPVISSELWNKAKSELLNKYKNSTCIDNIIKLMSDFETTHYEKYMSDLEQFIIESKYEDFYEDDDLENIYVSTIHKSKGREFDSVYMMLKNEYLLDNEDRRSIYVGMTRAKSNLYIHENTGIFKNYNIDGVKHIKDEKEYEKPSKIALQTTHKDVVLSYFKDKKEDVLKLCSGMPLKIEDVYLTAEINGKEKRIAKFSKAFREKIAQLKEKGYVLTSANICFIVNWKDEEDEEETPIILANIFLKIEE